MFDNIVDFFKSAITEQVVKDPYWAIWALAGQFIFGGRFVYQWLASEYKKRSYVPTAGILVIIVALVNTPFV